METFKQNYDKKTVILCFGICLRGFSIDRPGFLNCFCNQYFHFHNNKFTGKNIRMEEIHKTFEQNKKM